MPHSVVKAIHDHIQLESEIGGYEAADLKEKEIKAFYTSAANLFKCKPANIAFTSSATDSFSRAISSIVFKPGDVILTTNEDYISNQITYLSFIKRFGIKLVRAKTSSYGEVDLNDFEDCLQNIILNSLR